MTKPTPIGIIDVGRAIDEGPWNRFQKLALGIICLCIAADGLANNVLAIAIPALIRDWHTGKAAFALVAALSLTGMAIGTVVGGALGDRFGRKTVLLGSVLIFGAATLAMSFMSNVESLTALRLVDGIGIGGVMPSATSLIAELTPARRRARAISIAVISNAIGGLICGLIGSYVLPLAGWQALFVINGSIAIITAAIVLVALPESPRFLVRQPRGRAELPQLLRRLDIAVESGDSLIDTTQPRMARGPVSALVGPEMILTTFGIWGAFAFGLVAVFCALTWIPTVLAEQGLSLSVASASISAWSVGGIFGAVIGGKLIERFGSRAALLLLVVVGAIAMSGLASFDFDPRGPSWPFMLDIAVVGTCLNGYTSCLYALAAHVYPPIVRATGIGIAGALARCGAVVSSFAAVAVLGLGKGAFFLFVGGIVLLSGGCLLLIRSHIPNEETMRETGEGAVPKRVVTR
jgi:AAHS family 4-hydroxybenzoate transporter-like MFS transporter